MNKNNKSTPLAPNTDETSVEARMPDTSNLEPAGASSKENMLEVKADINKNANRNEELIFGKFKTLEDAQKGYKEAERAITRAADLERRLEQYRALSEKYEQDAIARGQGYADRLEMALDHDVKNHELDNYALAAAYTLSPQKRLDILNLINHYKQNGVPDDLARIRRAFSPDVIALAAEDSAIYRASRLQDYENMRQQDRQMRFSRLTEDFQHRYGDWLDSPLKATLLNEALEVSDGKVDLDALKNFVDEVEKAAVRKFQTIQMANNQNAEMQEGLKVPTESNPHHKNKKWLTKEEFYKLTPKQEAEKYDLIVEQVRLEKEGLLPQMLTL